MNLLKQRTIFETVFVVAITLLFSLFISVLGASALKFQIAFGVGLFGLIVIALIPARRTLCLCLWILIQPLSIEKIVYSAPPIWDGLNPKDLVINAADVLLIAILFMLFFQKIFSNKSIFVWDKTVKLTVLLLLWGVGSYLVHLAFYHSEFVHSVPLGIVHLFRNLLFVIIISAAIQTRSDLIWVLVSLCIIILFESVLVMLSFTTGEEYNFRRLLGISGQLQQYTNGEEMISRGSGTLGQPNNQAIFHTAFTFLIFGLFSLKNAMFRLLGLVAILVSFIAIIFTFSRGAWLTMGVGAMIIVFIFIKRNEITQKALLMASIVSILFIIVLAILAKPMIDRLIKGDDGATDSRVRMIMLAKDLALEYPIFGVGPGSYAEAGLHLYPPGEKETEWVALGNKAIVPPLGRVELATSIVPGEKPQRFALPVHNKYMLTVAEMGLVGLLIWILILKNFFDDARKCASSKDSLFRFVGVAGLATSVALSIYMMLDLFADDKTLQVILFPLLVTSAAYRLSKKSNS
jgi:O-antigen ligase